MTGSTAAVTVTDLRKAFGDHQVLAGIDLDAATGSIFALLGPNGAGKTTMVQILSTLITADHGTVTVGGHDVAHHADGVRSTIGVTGQFSAVDKLLTVRENLALMADRQRLPRTWRRARPAEMIERFALADVADKPSLLLSGGMRRRLDLAMSLIGEPKIIFLDEPTAGLDPRSRRTCGTWSVSWPPGG